MNTKLTLNLNKSIIEEAKFYAKKNSVSLSKLIENYLNSLTKSSTTQKKISPLVKGLTGVIPNKKVDERKDYKDYLTKKYA
jgi:hypothetical protein